MVCLLKIYGKGTRRAYSEGITLNAVALEGIHLELFLEPLRCGIVHEGPFVNSGYVSLVPKEFPDPLLLAALDHEFLGRE